MALVIALCIFLLMLFLIWCLCKRRHRLEKARESQQNLPVAIEMSAPVLVLDRDLELEVWSSRQYDAGTNGKVYIEFDMGDGTWQERQLFFDGCPRSEPSLKGPRKDDPEIPNSRHQVFSGCSTAKRVRMSLDDDAETLCFGFWYFTAASNSNTFTIVEDKNGLKGTPYPLDSDSDFWLDNIVYDDENTPATDHVSNAVIFDLPDMSSEINEGGVWGAGEGGGRRTHSLTRKSLHGTLNQTGQGIWGSEEDEQMEGKSVTATTSFGNPSRQGSILFTSGSAGVPESSSSKSVVWDGPNAVQETNLDTSFSSVRSSVQNHVFAGNEDDQGSADEDYLEPQFDNNGDAVHHESTGYAAATAGNRLSIASLLADHADEVDPDVDDLYEETDGAPAAENAAAATRRHTGEAAYEDDMYSMPDAYPDELPFPTGEIEKTANLPATHSSYAVARAVVNSDSEGSADEDYLEPEVDTNDNYGDIGDEYALESDPNAASERQGYKAGGAAYEDDMYSMPDAYPEATQGGYQLATARTTDDMDNEMAHSMHRSAASMTAQEVDKLKAELAKQQAAQEEQTQTILHLQDMMKGERSSTTDIPVSTTNQEYHRDPALQAELEAIRNIAAEEAQAARAAANARAEAQHVEFMKLQEELRLQRELMMSTEARLVRQEAERAAAMAKSSGDDADAQARADFLNAALQQARAAEAEMNVEAKLAKIRAEAAIDAARIQAEADKRAADQEAAMLSLQTQLEEQRMLVADSQAKIEREKAASIQRLESERAADAERLALAAITAANMEETARKRSSSEMPSKKPSSLEVHQMRERANTVNDIHKPQGTMSFMLKRPLTKALNSGSGGRLQRRSSLKHGTSIAAMEDSMDANAILDGVEKLFTECASVDSAQHKHFSCPNPEEYMSRDILSARLSAAQIVHYFNSSHSAKSFLNEPGTGGQSTQDLIDTISSHRSDESLGDHGNGRWQPGTELLRDGKICFGDFFDAAHHAFKPATESKRRRRPQSVFGSRKGGGAKHGKHTFG